MKLNFNKALAVSLVSTTSLLFGCVDNEKNFYDSTSRTQNPMGEVVAPEGFDWRLTSTVKLTVNVNDELGGQYYYVIDVFDENPVLSSTANLLDKGVARKGEAFSTEISVPTPIQTIYIRQTTPTGLCSVRAYETTGGVIDCNFGNLSEPATARSIAATRGFVAVEVPNTDNTNLFPQLAPKDLEQFNGSDFKANKSYEVKKANHINLGQAQNIKLYVTENINLESEIYLTNNSTLYILPGVTVTMPKSMINGQNNCLISVGKGATLKISGNIQLDSNFKLYNLGIVSADNFTCTNQSFFYNKGVAAIATKLEGTNSGSNILNEGDLTANDITISGDSHIINRGKVTVKALTTANCTGGSWENDGEWVTENMNIQGWNESCINKCKLTVNQLLHMTETILINDAGAFGQCKNLYMNNTKIEFGSKSLFVVTEQAKYGYNTKEKGFKGTGSEKALLKIKKAIAEFSDNADIVHYVGKLQIACDDHPEASLGWGYRWTMTNGAEWASQATATVDIPKTECNEGSGTHPNPPTNPDFPIIIEPKEKYSLMFEDQWPLYGDYDMNDIILGVNGLKYKTDKDNETKEFSFTVTLQAVGALKSTAAAVMLDKINATEIESIEYNKSPKPTTFDITGSGIEKNQQFAVIPLFDDAHQLMGRKNGTFINTQSGSNDNVAESDFPEIEITIKLKSKVSKSNFNINNMNFFVITDKAAKRKEVHMVGYTPSNLANTLYFGNNDDNSSNSGNKYYTSKDNLAWGIVVPQQIRWPLEYNNIKDVYSEFEGWITSGGTKNKKWYNNFNNEKTFQK